MEKHQSLSTNVQNTALVGGLKVTTVDDLARIGKMLEMSRYFEDAKDASQAAVKVLAGLELGVPVMAAMAGINIIKGKPVMSANLMAACVKRNEKYDYKVLEHTDTKCRIQFLQEGEELGVSEFTTEDAKKAGITGGVNWQKYPKNMLFARAMSNGVKWYASDIFLGAPVYTEDELISTTTINDQDHNDEIIDVVDAIAKNDSDTKESHRIEIMRKEKEKVLAEKKENEEIKRTIQCDAEIAENERCEEMLSDAEVKFCSTTQSKKMLCFIHQTNKN